MTQKEKLSRKVLNVADSQVIRLKIPRRVPTSASSWVPVLMDGCSDRIPHTDQSVRQNALKRGRLHFYVYPGAD